MTGTERGWARRELYHTNMLGRKEFIPVGIANFLHVEQLWTYSSYLHALKNVSPTPDATVPDCAQGMCVIANPVVHSILQGPCSRMYFNENTLQNINFNNFIFLSFLQLVAVAGG